MLFWLILVSLVYFLPLFLVWFLENKFGKTPNKNTPNNSVFDNSENSQSSVENFKLKLKKFLKFQKVTKSWILGFAVLTIFIAYWLFHKGIWNFSWNNFGLHFAGGMSVGLIFEYFLANLNEKTETENLTLRENLETENSIWKENGFETEILSAENLETFWEIKNLIDSKNNLQPEISDLKQNNHDKSSKNWQKNYENNLEKRKTENQKTLEVQAEMQTEIQDKINSQENFQNTQNLVSSLQNSFWLQFLMLYFLVSGLGVGNEILEMILDRFSKLPFSSDRYDTWFDLTANTCGAFSLWLLLYFARILWKNFKS